MSTYPPKPPSVEGLPLFGTSKIPETAPYVRDSVTSKAAAKEIIESASTLRARVYRAIRDAGTSGLTDEEIQLSLNMNPSTQRPRRVELCDAGLVKDSEQKRKTQSGRQAVVWIVNDKPA